MKKLGTAQWKKKANKRNFNLKRESKRIDYPNWGRPNRHVNNGLRRLFRVERGNRNLAWGYGA